MRILIVVWTMREESIRPVTAFEADKRLAKDYLAKERIVTDMASKAERPKVPKFENEAEEARWWDEHKAMVEENLMQAMRDGTAQLGTAQRLGREARESKNITIRMPIADIERARKLSVKKGLGYQTLIKMLLHEALEREEKRRAG